MPARVVISGASGFIGSALTSLLRQRGAQVEALVRPGSRAAGIRWDPAAGSIDAGALDGVDALVHLAGEGIADGRWTEAQKTRIKQSRVQGTSLLARTLATLSGRPAVWVCASGVNVYGDRGAVPVDEGCEPGAGFLADVVQAWESATSAARDGGVRVVNARLGPVLHPKGGALAKLLLPFRLGVGGPLGDGQQYMSWVALSDAVHAIAHLLFTSTLSGPVNVTAPHPLTNAEFSHTLGKVLRRPSFLRLPAFAARALLGQLAEEALLSGARVLPRRLLESGFVFDHPDLEPYLRSVLAKPPPACA